jgi:hypothetical protein
MWHPRGQTRHPARYDERCFRNNENPGKKTRKDRRVNQFRGILMLLAAGVAFWRGWKIHAGHTALLAYGLGALALGLAFWHLSRKPDRPRV